MFEPLYLIHRTVGLLGDENCVEGIKCPDRGIPGKILLSGDL